MKKILDERIISESRKQNSVGFLILYFGLLLVLLYRQFIRMQPLEEIWDLHLLFFGVTFFIAFKKVFAGFYIQKSRKLLIVNTAVFTAVQYFFLNRDKLSGLILGAFVFFIASIGFELLMRYISKRKNDKLLDE